MSEHRIHCHYGEKIINSQNNQTNQNNKKTVCPPPALTDKIINPKRNIGNGNGGNGNGNGNGGNGNGNGNSEVSLCSGNKAYIINKPNQSKKMRNAFLIRNGRGKKFFNNGN